MAVSLSARDAPPLLILSRGSKLSALFARRQCDRGDEALRDSQAAVIAAELSENPRNPPRLFPVFALIGGYIRFPAPGETVTLTPPSVRRGL